MGAYKGGVVELVEGDLFSAGGGFDEEVEGREEIGLEEVV